MDRSRPVEGMGECRRKSPSAWSEHDLKASEPRAVFAYWPWTLDDQFCGEFERRRYKMGEHA